MSTEEFQEIVKSALAQIRENTISDLIENDRNYQSSSEVCGEAERAYMEIASELNPEHREIIDEYIEAVNANNIDYNDLMYLAGMRDMFRFLKSYNLIEKMGK